MAVADRIESLRRSHKEAERELHELEQHPGADPEEVNRVKRKKLALKDEIASLEREAVA